MVNTDAVVHVDHEVALLEVPQGSEVLRRAGFPAAAAFGPVAQGLIFGEDDEPAGWKAETAGNFPHGDFH